MQSDPENVCDFNSAARYGRALWLFIDVQNIFVLDPDIPAPGRLLAAEMIADAAAKARQAGHMVAWVNMVRPHENALDTQLQPYPAGQDRLRDLFGLKSTVSGMRSGDLPSILRQARPSSIVLGGFLMNRCVYETALDIRRDKDLARAPIAMATDCGAGTLVSREERAHLDGVLARNYIVQTTCADVMTDSASCCPFKPPGPAP